MHSRVSNIAHALQEGGISRHTHGLINASTDSNNRQQVNNVVNINIGMGMGLSTCVGMDVSTGVSTGVGMSGRGAPQGYVASLLLAVVEGSKVEASAHGEMKGEGYCYRFSRFCCSCVAATPC